MKRDALTEAEAIKRSGRVEDVSYTLALIVDRLDVRYEGEATVEFYCQDPAAGTFLDFTGDDLMELEVNGRAVRPEERHPFRIELPGSHLRAENRVRIRYRNEYDRTGVGFHRFEDPEDGEVYLYTDFEPYCAHRLFPCFDQPDIKATYDLEVTAPSDWSVIANGAEISSEPVDAESARRRFAVLEPFSTYLFALIAGPYESEHDDNGEVPLGVHCRRSLKPFLDHQEIFDITRRGLGFYTDYFQQPYPFGKYDQIFVPEFNSGAMENVGAVTFNEAQVFRDPPTDTQRLMRAEVVLHELAHMWFGNLVTMKWWDGLWLNESFATYISFLAMSEATRFQDCWQNFLGSIKTWAYREDQKPTTHPIACTVEDTEQTFLNFDGITYGKGAAVLKQLRATLGADAFRDGLRLYFDRHAWGNTVIEDFIRALADASGTNLERWSHLWIETSGVNAIRVELTAEGVQLRQTPGNGDGVLRPHLVAVSTYGPDEDSLVATEPVTLQLDGETTPVPLTGQAPALIWPNHDDHAYARVLLDERSMDCVRSSLGAIEDPLVRMGIWCTAWEMVRDGLLSPADHIGLGIRFLGAEQSAEIVDANLRLITVSLRRYMPPDRQPELGAMLLEAACEACERHGGQQGDLQLLWGRAAPGFVASCEQAADLARWLEGEAPGGLPVDQGLRWRVIGRLAAFGVGGVSGLIASEAERDPSDRGVKARFAAESATPDLEHKEALFEGFINPREGDSADLLKAGMSTFFQPHQSDALQDLGLRYFSSVEAVVENQDLEYATRGFARLLSPLAIASPELEAAGEAAMKHAGPSPVLRRILLEECDELARAVRLRQGTERP